VVSLTRVLERKRLISPVTLVAGDSVQVTERRAGGVERILVEHVHDGPMRTYDEALVFEGDEDGRHVIGGAIVEQRP
jgi:hypothetical protein